MIRTSFAAALPIVAMLFCIGPNGLAQAPNRQPFVPTVKVDKNVKVPMRDGVTLATDIYYPDGPGPFPVMLSRTPYNKDGAARNADFFAKNGYVVVVQDSRGLYESSGEWRPYIDEGPDGYDTQQWIGQQKWCNGKIGMFGRSYPAYTQVVTAPFRSPYVKAIMPEAAQSSNFEAVWSWNGIYHLALGLSWGTGQEAIHEKKPRPSPSWMEVMNHLPLKTSMDLTGIHSPFVLDSITHTTYDDFWQRMSIREKYSQMDVPAFHMSGWYDDLVHETILNFVNMRKLSRSENARRWQKLMIGPWGHGVRADSKYGDVDFGTEMQTDLQQLHLHWYNYHLKGVQDGLDREAPIRIFVMGENKWRDEQEWPPARAHATRVYLSSHGHANTRMGDGALAEKAPGSEPADKYAYDPRYPVPTWGGHGSGGGGITQDGAFSVQGPMDQRSIEQRSDVLVYTSDELRNDMEVTGTVELNLFFSTDVKDTDFFATLSDVYPDGRAILITEGALRTRYSRFHREDNALDSEPAVRDQNSPVGDKQSLQGGSSYPPPDCQCELPAFQPKLEFREIHG
jgi:putative CocE/NonD family hydrolase